MSGHSKWTQIKHKKGTADQKRGNLFTKLGNAITVAARQAGGDVEVNFSLRLAVDKAKAFNMPKENIERAIKRGTGELAGEKLEEVTYEGFGPGKVALVIECLTPNKNRTVSEIKHILEKQGGTLAGPGAVRWMFEKRGVITINKKQLTINKDEVELKLIDAGADDIEEGEEEIVLYAKSENLQKVKENLEKEAEGWDIEINSAGLELVAKEKIEVTDEINEKLEKLFEELDEHQEVSSYYTNLS